MPLGQATALLKDHSGNFLLGNHLGSVFRYDPQGRTFVYDGENKQIEVLSGQSNRVGPARGLLPGAHYNTSATSLSRQGIASCCLPMDLSKRKMAMAGSLEWMG